MKLGGSTAPAHRVAWELKNGAVPTGLCVLHACDNPPCCRVDHNADMVAKGRHAHGEGSGVSRLSTAQVREIKDQQGRATGRLVAARFGVCVATVHQIWNGRTWGHVE